MNRDIPIAKIRVTPEETYELLELLCNDPKLLPFDLKYHPNSRGLQSFIEFRITPKTRQGLQESMEAFGLKRYCISDMLIVSNGRDCNDMFWIRFNTGPQTWKEVWEAVGVTNRR